MNKECQGSDIFSIRVNVDCTERNHKFEKSAGCGQEFP